VVLIYAKNAASQRETWSLTLREGHRLRVTENRVLRRVFRPRREDVAGGRRTLHNEELHNLYVAPNSVRVIKSRRMRLAGNTARMGDEKCIQYFLLENLKRRDHFEDLGVDGKVIVQCILGK
jgi:hypothetical protein